MPEGFTLYEDKKAPGGTRPGKGRPQSAGPKSKGGKGGGNIHGAIAKSDTKNKGRAAAMKAYYGDNSDVGDSLALMSKEALLLEVNELKKKNKLLEKQSGQVKAENQRLEDEIKKQQQRIDRLMDPAAAARSGLSASGTRKEVEKSLLVRHLKQQVATLRSTISDKDNELEMVVRSAKMSNISELITEREEYYYECRRLKSVVKNLRTELALAKRSKKGNNEEVEMQLRKEVTRLAAGYQDILGTIRARTIRGQEQAGGNTGGRGMESGMMSAPNTKDDGDLGAGALIPDQDMARPAENKSPKKSTNQHNRPQLDIVGGPKHKMTESLAKELPYKIGDRVEGQFQGQGSWYKATVKYITGPNTLHLLYDDGDEERNADVKFVRPDGHAAPAEAVAESTGGGEYEEEFEEENAGSKFKVKDKIDALYYNGSTWYSATVGAVHNVAGQWHYDVEYDDGDREKKVHESKVRAQEGAKAPTPAPAPAPAATKPAEKPAEKPATPKMSLDELLGSPPKKASDYHSSRKERETKPKDYSTPSVLAQDLRTAIKSVLKNYTEYRAAFASMTGSASEGVYEDTTTDLTGFQPFAEDVLQRVITSSKIAELYDEVARGQESVSFKAFVTFAEGKSPIELLKAEESTSAKRRAALAVEEAEAEKKKQTAVEMLAAAKRKEEEELARGREEERLAAAEEARIAKEEHEAALQRQKEREHREAQEKAAELLRDAERKKEAEAARKRQEEQELALQREADLAEQRRIEETLEAARQEEEEELERKLAAARAKEAAEAEISEDENTYTRELLASPAHSLEDPQSMRYNYGDDFED